MATFKMENTNFWWDNCFWIIRIVIISHCLVRNLKSTFGFRVLSWCQTSMAIHLLNQPFKLKKKKNPCIQPGLVICFTLDSIHVSMLFSWNILPSAFSFQCMTKFTKKKKKKSNANTQLSSVESLSHVLLVETPWIAVHPASLSITNSQSLLKHMPIESVMPSSHLILCRPLLLLPPIPPNIRVFSNESTLCMRWPKYWSFSFSISPSDEHPGLISFWMDWLDLLAVQGTLKSLLQYRSSGMWKSLFLRYQLEKAIIIVKRFIQEKTDQITVIYSYGK